MIPKKVDKTVFQVYNTGKGEIVMQLCSLGMSPNLARSCPLHRHDSWEIVLNVSGTGEALVEGQSYPFEAGTIMCIPPGLEHLKQSENGFNDLYFHTDALPDSARFPTDRPVLLRDDAGKSFETLIRLMLQLYYHKSPNGRAVVQQLHSAAVQLLIGWFLEKRPDPLVEQVQNRLIASFADPEINIAALLSDSGYSEDYMRRRFREETGKTPMEYLTGLRIEYARQLLDQKKSLQLSIGEIALMCGYYDVHYFSRTFRRLVGCSPRDYLQRDKTPVRQDPLRQAFTGSGENGGGQQEFFDIYQEDREVMGYAFNLFSFPMGYFREHTAEQLKISEAARQRLIRMQENPEKTAPQQE